MEKYLTISWSRLTVAYVLVVDVNWLDVLWSIYDVQCYEKKAWLNDTLSKNTRKLGKPGVASCLFSKNTAAN